jgi:molybdopterin/thiamine biosynthesis adenylyltransferase
LLNGWAQRHRRALLSGGTSAFGGTCAVYEPGKTACLSCRFDIDRLAEREQQPESCGRVPEASVVTSNAITGALMVLALLEMLGGHVPMGVWEYDGSAQERRIDHRSPRPACGCHRRGMV